MIAISVFLAIDSSFTPKNVHSALKPLVDWKSLAFQLEMSATKIEEIDFNNQRRMADCRREMIQFWLQSDTSCSWQKLIGALKSTDHSALAEEIKFKYCPMFQGQLVKIVTITYVVCVRELCARFPGALCVVCKKHSDFSYDIGGWAFHPMLCFVPLVV